MALNTTGLLLLIDGAFGTGPQLWSYTSTDTSTDVGALGYFSGMGVGSWGGSPKGMRIGDHVIAAQITTGTTPGQTSFHTVTKSSANGSTLGSTFGYDVSVSTAPVSTL